MSDGQKNIIVIVGPTASGKSAHGITQAQKHDGVIINADSMQVYRDLPILTAQPSGEDLEAAPHKLYSILDGAVKCNAQQWTDMARAEIVTCFADKKTPILVGGTGFYLKSLMEGLSPIPDVPDDVRDMSNALLEMIGAPALHAIVSAQDPEIGAQLEKNDSQRLAHAWAVHETTGKPLSHWQNLPRVGPPESWHFNIIRILPDRETLKERIEARFDQMLEGNVMDEVIALHNRVENGEIDETAGIIVSHGFRALRDYHVGKIALNEARHIGISDTKKYAKRQFTWFKNQIKNTKNTTLIETIT